MTALLSSINPIQTSYQQQTSTNSLMVKLQSSWYSSEILRFDKHMRKLVSVHFYSFLHTSKSLMTPLNTLRLRQNGRHFADDNFKHIIFLNENVRISIKISLKFVPKDPINNIPALVQIMAWHRPGDMLLSEPIMVRVPTYMCVTRPQWVNHSEELIWLNNKTIYFQCCIYDISIWKTKMYPEY